VRENLIENGSQLRTKGQTEEGTDVYNFYTPVMSRNDDQNNKLVGFARVTVSLEEIAVQRRAIFKYGSVVTFLITLAGSIIAYLIAVTVTGPIRSLTKGAEEIGKGNLEHRIEVSTGGETKELAKTLNHMAENLQESRERLKEAKKSLEVQVKARTKELRELNQELEDRVQKRTQELRKRVSELERFHRLTVGREMKMIELKDKIKELKKKLKQCREENNSQENEG
ncbi:MAG: HAMP domain-containing protein, partial [Candidatus Paceibacterota bacterium]